MFKYIKWELLSLGKKNLKWLMAILGFYALIAIIPETNDEAITELLFVPFYLSIGIFSFGTFIFGTKKVIDTFRKKTFLLESMVSLTPYKILLAKYILALILNTVCLLLATLGVIIALSKSYDMSFIFELFGESISEIGFDNIMKFVIYMAMTSILFTSLVTLCYVIAKCIMPNGKGSIVIGIIAWYILVYFIGYFDEYLFPSETADILSTKVFILENLLIFGFIAFFYLITVRLIENKLEIYN